MNKRMMLKEAVWEWAALKSYLLSAGTREAAYSARICTSPILI